MSEVEVIIVTALGNRWVCWEHLLRGLVQKQVLCRLISPQSPHFTEDIRRTPGCLILVDAELTEEQWATLKMSRPKVIFSGRVA